MNRSILILMLFGAALPAGNVFAVLPPDAVARAPQIRADYVRSARAFQQQQELRQSNSVAQYKKTEAAIYTPPWLRAGTPDAMQARAERLAAAEAEKAQKRNHRLLASILLLILIGAAAGWVRHATREIDKQY